MPVFLILSNWKEKKISTLFNQISLIFFQYFIRKRRIQGFFEFIHWTFNEYVGAQKLWDFKNCEDRVYGGNI